MTSERTASGKVGPDDHEDVATDNARQGETGHGVRYMLGISVVLAIAAMALTALVAFS